MAVELMMVDIKFVGASPGSVEVISDIVTQAVGCSSKHKVYAHGY